MESADFDLLDAQIRACDRCAPLLKRHPENPPGRNSGVVPRPILSRPMRAPIMLIGQAPGIDEYDSGKPFSGGAGLGIRELFAKCGVSWDGFDRLVYQTSVVKCFPGRKIPKGRPAADRKPCSAMLNNCTEFMDEQIRVVDPRIIVTLGDFARKWIDKRLSLPKRTLTQAVGTSHDWEGRLIVYLAHTSGSSRWHNDPSNRMKQVKAKEILSGAIASLDVSGLTRVSLALPRR